MPYRLLTLLVVFLCALAPAVAQDDEPTSHSLRIDMPATVGEDFLNSVRRDTAWFAAWKTRCIGTPEHEAAIDELIAQVESIPGVRVWIDPFEMAVPVVTTATITVNAGPVAGQHAIYPMWPAGSRMNTTPEGGLSGRLIYIGEAKVDQIPAASLHGNIAVMEASGDEDWKNAAASGAAAIICLDGPSVTQIDYKWHDIQVPISTPRFYLPDGPLAEALRKTTSTATLVSEGKFLNMQARNVYALLEPPQHEEPRKAIAIVAQSDSMAFAPQYAPGADAALDTGLAVSTLRYFAEQTQQGRTPEHPLLFAFIDAYAINMRGMRQMLGTLSVPPDSQVRNRQIRSDLDNLAEVRKRTELWENLQQTGDPVHLVYHPTFKDLHENVKNEASLDKVDLDNLVEPLRVERHLLRKAMNAVRRTGDDTDTRVSSETREYVLTTCGIDLYQDRDLPEAERERLISQLESRRETIASETQALLEERSRAGSAATRMLKGPKIPLGEKFTAFFGGKDAASGTDWAQVGAAQIPPELLGEAKRLLNRAGDRMEHEKNSILKRLEQRMNRDRLRNEITRALGFEVADPGLTPQQVSQANLTPPQDTEIKQGTLPSSESPLFFVFGIEISDAGIAVGTNTSGRLWHNWDTQGTDPFMDWLAEVHRKEADALWPDDIQHGLTMAPYETSDTRNSYTVGEQDMITALVTSFGLPSIAWSTLDAFRYNLGTGKDTFDRLRWERINPQVLVTIELMKRMAYDPDFAPENRVEARWRRVEGRIVDQAPGEPSANLPREGYVTSLVLADAAGYGAVQSGRYITRWWMLGVSAIRRQEFTFSDAAGRFAIPDMPGNVWLEVARYALQAHKLAEDGSIVSALDLRQVGRGINVNTNLQLSQETDLRGIVFPCIETNAYHFYDPRFLIDLQHVTLLDARRQSMPKRMNFSFNDGAISALLEPDVRWLLIMRIGITANRMLMLNVLDPTEHPDVRMRDLSQGWPTNEALPRHSTFLAARDMFRLDERRLQIYREAGITSEAVERIQKRTQELLELAEKAHREDDGGAVFYAATGALANEVRGYEATRSLGNDVVRAAIFLLLALIPFSFAMERLLIANTHVYHQILGTVLIFAVMTGILWWFHPAFAISNQPLIIIMAFAIIFMSLLVGSMIFFKFKASIEEMKSQRAESSGAQTSRMGVAATAVKLGIANMRKRKLRTALTGITVVLITFALLCFSSTSTYRGEREYEISLDEREVPYTGLLLRQMSQRSIRDRTVMYFENILNNLESDPEAFGALDNIDPETRVAYRYWWLDPFQRHFGIHVRNPENGKQVSLRAALGLSGNESFFTPIDEYLPNWDRFAEAERNWSPANPGGCYIAEEVARTLDVEPGDYIAVAGSSLEVLGTYAPETFEKENLYGLDGHPITPLNFSALSEQQRLRNIAGDADMGMLSQELRSGAGIEPDQNLPHHNASRVIIVPAPMLEGMRDASLRAISLRTETREEARALAKQFAHRFAFPIYYGSEGEGVNVMAAMSLLAGSPRSLLVLMILAGLIILNTMLSSVAERKGEIYIYTSLGLAPLHIAVLFLAEAVTYGLMGSVFGYVIGQGVATGLSAMGWLGSITLNYSGTQTIVTMGIVLAVVFVSSLIPAYMAGRLAVPSNEMTWRVPEPKDGVIRDSLPFTVTTRTANGTLAYLADYLDAHREGSIGCFTLDDMQLYHLPPTENGPEEGLLGIRGTVWLAPYDLGVRQDFDVRLSPTDDPEVLNIDIELSGASGQTNNWVKLNKTWLGDLRRQLLGWRNLKVERILEYINDAEDMARRTNAAQG